MGMVKRQAEANPGDSRRRLIVIILSCCLTLLVAWPAADVYFATRQQQVLLQQRLHDARQAAESSEQLNSVLEQKTKQLVEAQARGISIDDVHEFRRQLVEITRSSGCRVRRIQIGKPHSRGWKIGDDPLITKAGSNKKTPDGKFRLISQQLDLTIDGKLPAVRELLDSLAERKKLLHTESFTLRPTKAGGSDVTVQMRLLLFDLEDKTDAEKTDAA